jgi:apolipoprotein N-acyltransferase
MKFILKNKKYITSLVSGASLVLIFAPFYLFFFGFISITALFLVIDNNKNCKTTFYHGLFYGFGFFLAGNHWIAISLLVDASQHAWLIPFALTLIPLALAVYIALACLLYKYLINKIKTDKIYYKIIIFSSCWLLFEILRSNLFSGFPWNLIGYSWLFNLNLAQSASIIGIYGLSFFAILLFLSPAIFIRLKNNKIKIVSFKKLSKSDLSVFVIIIALLISSFFFGWHRLNNVKLINKGYKIRLVQANIEQNLKWDPKEKYNNLIKHIKLTNKKNIDDIDMVVWSEASIPYVVDYNPNLSNLIKLAVPKNGTLVSGALRSDKNKYWNSIFLFNEDGVKDYYDKHHLVPFGEYIPLQKYLPFVKKITQGSEGFSRGIGAKHLVDNNITFSPLVCYEAIFTSYSVDISLEKPHLLLNLTNDSWFGNSIGPHQHLAMAQMRSIEYGITMVRVSNSGISAHIDPFGKIKSKTEIGKEEVFDIDLNYLHGDTIYQKIIRKLGDIF